MTQILEARVTNPKRQECLAIPHGIAIVILNTRNEILLGKETETDNFRQSGQWNILTETWDSNVDIRIKNPVARALQEELGAPMEWFSVIQGSYRETNGLYIKAMGYSFKYRCICLHYLGDPYVPAYTVFRAQSGEISEHRWFRLSTLPNTLEIGARIVIDAYLEAGLAQVWQKR